MRKTLFAMVGLLALGLWALPALAGDYDLPKVQEPTPLDARAGRLGAMFRGDDAAYKGTLSGTLIKQAQAVTTWYLYPNACNERLANTWAPQTAIVADSLNGYVGQAHGYPLEDQSLKERLWHLTNGSDTPGGEYDPVLVGSWSLWCGKFDPNYVVKVGYPNLTFQILYMDTGLHGGAYNLSWVQNVSTEFNYDYLYVIGGNGGAADPIGNSRAILDHITDTGSDAAGNLLVTMTGSMNAPLALTYAGPPGVQAPGLGAGAPATVTFALNGIPAAHRAIYLLFYADCLFSSEDGLWPEGHGQILDVISTNDNGLIYDEGAPSGGVDAFSGDVLIGTPGAPIMSARVAPGVGELWRLNAGNNLPTADFCSPQKAASTDKMFEAGDATTHFTIAASFASVRTCTMPIPTGAASVLAIWGEYLDLPRQSGFVQQSEFRIYKGGSWGLWTNTAPGGGVRTGALQAWTIDGDELAAATQADSVQIRYNLQCIPAFAVDRVNCQPVLYGIIYDDFRLEILTGVPAPIFGIFVGSVAQSHFVDGTDMSGTNCTGVPVGSCWPGIRGSALSYANGGVKDNFNCGYGDSITLALATGLRKNGMGINWQYGFDKTVVHQGVGALKISRLNGAFNPAYDVPRIIFRLYDPAKAAAGLPPWSPWDSSALDPTSVALSGPDTILIDSEYRVNWPPRDKYYVNDGAGDIGPNKDESFPGGWTLNGNTKYGQVKFLPRGTRMQYYFKAVDINGGVSYQFTSDNAAREVEDLPYLPGSAIKAPDIIEFNVLPRIYAPGTAGSLAAGRTDAEVLNLDGAYSVWSNQFDPVTQALRGMGVRADRLRRLQGLGNGSAIGGHELPGQRLDRLSNYYPNVNEYNIVGLLAENYRIIIESSHLRSSTIYEEQDSKVVKDWWKTKTGTLVNDGDRCAFGSGDDMFNALLNASLAFPQRAEQVALSTEVFGVASVVNAWSNPLAKQYPVVDDRFAGGGPGLAAPNTFTYPIDGGCPTPNRFDGLTTIGSADAVNAVIYPDGVTEVAGVAHSTEIDAGIDADNDRNKALAYGYSIQFIRQAGIATSAANYVRSGVENRMRVLYKFLTSCRRNMGGKTPCWPCPSNAAEMTTNWASLTNGFNTATYGDLYPIQDHTMATGVELVAAPPVNRLDGAAPNPFNPETAIRFSAATSGKVTIRVFDVAGRLVNTLSKNVTEAGLNEIRWNGKASDGRPMASGMYFYKIRFANGEESEAKMTMLK